VINLVYGEDIKLVAPFIRINLSHSHHNGHAHDHRDDENKENHYTASRSPQFHQDEYRITYNETITLATLVSFDSLLNFRIFDSHILSKDECIFWKNLQIGEESKMEETETDESTHHGLTDNERLTDNEPLSPHHTDMDHKPLSHQNSNMNMDINISDPSTDNDPLSPLTISTTTSHDPIKSSPLQSKSSFYFNLTSSTQTNSSPSVVHSFSSSFGFQSNKNLNQTFSHDEKLHNRQLFLSSLNNNNESDDEMSIGLDHEIIKWHVLNSNDNREVNAKLLLGMQFIVDDE
jgi:hypothetical protein